MSETGNGFPAQSQERQPGREHRMTPRPEFELPEYRGSGKLEGKVALITGGDSGIGRAVAVLFAREGANLAIVYFDEEEDAAETCRIVERQEGQECLLIPCDVRREADCQRAISETMDRFGRLDILVNNAAVQFPQTSVLDITEEQLERTFRTNIFAHFFFVKAALPHLPEGASIINSSSVTAFRGSPGLMDYASTKGAIIAFTRSLAKNRDILDRKIRVNSVAPGPVWTPLIPASFDADYVQTFGEHTPMGRAGQPEEVAPAYVYLASADSTYVSGQTIHVNGGEVVGG